MLQSVAVAAAGVARQGDCLARIGGDEFALIAPGAGPSGVLRLLRDLREAVEPAATYAAGLVPDDARTPEELVACADARLLAQKRNAKSPPAIQRVAVGKRRLLTALDQEPAVALQLFAIHADRAAAAKVADHVPVDR